MADNYVEYIGVGETRTFWGDTRIGHIGSDAYVVIYGGSLKVDNGIAAGTKVTIVDNQQAQDLNKSTKSKSFDRIALRKAGSRFDVVVGGAVAEKVTIDTPGNAYLPVIGNEVEVHVGARLFSKTIGQNCVIEAKSANIDGDVGESTRITAGSANIGGRINNGSIILARKDIRFNTSDSRTFVKSYEGDIFGEETSGTVSAELGRANVGLVKSGAIIISAKDATYSMIEGHVMIRATGAVLCQHVQGKADICAGGQVKVSKYTGPGLVEDVNTFYDAQKQDYIFPDGFGLASGGSKGLSNDDAFDKAIAAAIGTEQEINKSGTRTPEVERYQRRGKNIDTLQFPRNEL